MKTKHVLMILLAAFVLLFGVGGVWRTSHAFIAQMYLGRGVSSMSHGQYEDAMREYDRALSYDPDVASSVALDKGQVYWLEGKYDASLAEIGQAMELSPDDGGMYVSLAYVHMSQNKYQAAIDDCNRALELKPGLPDAYLIRGKAYADLGDDQQAIIQLTKYLTVATPGSYLAEGYIDRGVAYGSVGEYDKAVADFTKAAKYNKSNFAAYYDRGIIYRDIGEKEEAISDFKKSLTLTTDPTWIEKANAQIAELQGS